MWWNLNILRDALRKTGKLNLTPWSPVGSIPNLCILALKVLGLRPRIAAAPSFPSMRHRVSERVLRIWFRSISSKVFTVDDNGGDEISSLSASCKTGPGHRDHGPFNDTFHLTDVPGPRVTLQRLHRLLLDRRNLFPQLPGISLYEGLDQQRDVFCPLPEGRDGDGEDVEPIVKVLPKPAFPDLFLKVSICRCHDPYIDFDGMGRAQALKLVMLDRPDSLACISTGSSPISSRQRVEPWATSNRPTCRVSAPVNAPFSRPNNSLSIKLAGRAAQLTVISGRSLRGLMLWMAAAISSFPVPVSPRMRTVVFVGATCSAR